MTTSHWPHPFYHPLSIFRFTHRHFISLCLIDAALGYIFGYLFGHQYFGVIGGAVFSVYNYFYLNKKLFGFIF